MRNRAEIPILEEQTYKSVLTYIALQSIALIRTVLGQDLPMDTLTVFTHDPVEHIYMVKLLKSYGHVSRKSHGATLYVEVSLTVEGQAIKLLGVREPDETRPQVGYADFLVTNYNDIRDLSNPYIQEITSGLSEKLLEVRHPDFDVLGYVKRVNFR